MPWILKIKGCSGHYAGEFGDVKKSALNECIFVFIRLMSWLVLVVACRAG